MPPRQVKDEKESFDNREKWQIVEEGHHFCIEF